MVKTIKIYDIPRMNNWSLFIENLDNVPAVYEKELNWQELEPFQYTARIENVVTSSGTRLNSFAYCMLDNLFGTYSMSLISNQIWQITVDCRISKFKDALFNLKDDVNYWNLEFLDYTNAVDLPRNVKPFGELPTYSTRTGFDPQYFDKIIGPGRIVCQFIPSSGNKIRIGNYEFTLPTTADSLLNSQGSFTAIYPIRFEANNPSWSSMSVTVEDQTGTSNSTYVPSLRDILSSANLKSCNLLPTYTKDYSFSSNNTITFNTSTYTYFESSKVDNKSCFLLLSKGYPKDLTAINFYYNKITWTDLEKLHKNARYTLNFFGAHIAFTYEDCLQYKYSGIDELEIWTDLSGTDLYLCWHDYNGVLNRVPTQTGFPLLIDSWQQYVAQNPNYKDMLYNVPTKQAENQYRLAQSFNEQNYEQQWHSNLNGLFSGNFFDVMRTGIKAVDLGKERDKIREQNKQEFNMNKENIKLQADATIAQMKGGPNQVQLNNNTLAAGAITGDFSLYFGVIITRVISIFENMVDKLFKQNGVELVGAITKAQYKEILKKTSFRLSLSNSQVQLLIYQSNITNLPIQQIYYCIDYNQFIKEVNFITQ